MNKYSYTKGKFVIYIEVERSTPTPDEPKYDDAYDVTLSDGGRRKFEITVDDKGDAMSRTTGKDSALWHVCRDAIRVLVKKESRNKRASVLQSKIAHLEYRLGKPTAAKVEKVAVKVLTNAGKAYLKTAVDKKAAVEGFPFMGRGDEKKWFLPGREVEYRISLGRKGAGTQGGGLTYFGVGANTGKSIAGDRYQWWKLVGAAIRHAMKHHPDLIKQLDGYTKARAMSEAKSSLKPENERLASSDKQADVQKTAGKFELGRVVQTRGVNHKSRENPQFKRDVDNAFRKYVRGDWGISKDKRMNNQAVKNGDDRIMGVYKTSEGDIWIITEWDRSVTTMLFPNEY